MLINASCLSSVRIKNVIQGSDSSIKKWLPWAPVTLEDLSKPLNTAEFIPTDLYNNV